MTDPMRDESAPLTRRQAREAVRGTTAPTLPGEVARDVVGDRPAEPAAPSAAAPSAATEDASADRPAPTTLAEAAEQAQEDDAHPAHDTAPATASLDELFTRDHPTEKPGREKRRGGGCLIALVVVLAILGGITAGGWWAWTEYGPRIQAFMGWDGPSDYEPGEATGEVLVTIAEGDTGSAISETLFEEGVTLKPGSFYDHLVETAQNPTFYPGVYQLQRKMTSAAVLEQLQNPDARRENTVALQEGLTVDATLEAASTGLDMPLEDLQAAAADPSAYDVTADSLEGWLFPAYYTFDPGVTAQDVIRTMVDRTRDSLAEAGVAADDQQRVLTIASIIQREARLEEDFYKVSRVIYNRLDESISDTGGLLQMDSTAQFGVREAHGSAFSSDEQLTDPNPWNTYVHPGLPVGPIANPGDMAIDAAKSPAVGDWQYFVTVDLESGETVFSATHGEHEVAVQQLRDWCAAHSDYSGC